MTAKQRVRWADMEEGQKAEKGEELASWCNEKAEVSETKTERWMGQVTAAEEDRPGGERDENGEEEHQERAEERGQMDEEAMAADQKSSTERGIGIALRKKMMDSPGGKNWNGVRGRILILERRTFVWRVGCQGWN